MKTSRYGAMTLQSINHCALVGVVLATAASVSGCSMGSGSGLFGGGDDLASIDDVRGPTERRLQTVAYEQDAGVIASRADDPALQDAKRLFDAGQYRDAEKAYDAVLDRYRPGGFKQAFGNPRRLTGKKTADERAIDKYGSPIEQECLFMIAECQFASKDFPKAEEGYQRLLRRYPSTRHLDTVTRRIYTISRHWLGFPPVEISGGPSYEQSGDIQQVVFTDVQQSIDPAVAPKQTGWLNFTDGSKPVFDTTGRALNTLKSIWLNDPTGPLADDALILTANHYYRSGDPVEAARYYELLREQYPDSPHLKNAYLLESHVKLTSYIGNEYDDKSLDQAADLKRASLQIFPDLSADQKQILTQELNQIEDAKIAREWSLVEFYRQKGRPESVRLYCNSIINEYPDSRYADLAREMLGLLAEEERNGGQSWWPFGRRTPRPASPTVNPVAVAPVDLKSRPSAPTQPAIQTAAAPQSAPSASPRTSPRNFSEIFDAQTKPAVAASSQQPSQPSGPSPFEFSPKSTAKKTGSIQQVSAAAPAGNPFAEFMDGATATTEARKPVVNTAAWATPAEPAPAPKSEPVPRSNPAPVPAPEAAAWPASASAQPAWATIEASGSETNRGDSVWQAAPPTAADFAPPTR